MACNYVIIKIKAHIQEIKPVVQVFLELQPCDETITSVLRVPRRHLGRHCNGFLFLGFSCSKKTNNGDIYEKRYVPENYKFRFCSPGARGILINVLNIGRQGRKGLPGSDEF